jgi:membrane-bound lytic murein transglycosylase C
MNAALSGLPQRGNEPEGGAPLTGAKIMSPCRLLSWRSTLAPTVVLALGLVVPPGEAQQPNPPSAEFEGLKKKTLGEFAAFKQEFEEYKKIVSQERDRYSGRVSERWDEPELSSPKIWVEYSDDLSERNRVDFENETITLEIVRTGDLEIAEESDAYRAKVRARMEELVTKNAAQAFAEDVVAQAVEQRSKKEIGLLRTAEVPPEPILIPYLTGIDTQTPEQAVTAAAYGDAIVDEMMKERKTTRTTNRRGETVIKTEVPLAAPQAITEAARAQQAKKAGGRPASPRTLPRRAAALWGHVNQNAKVAGVSKALVYAVIETESAFDPMATSWIPAYGLMQIVPESAGLDVTETLFGKAQILAPSYLYVGRNNIEIGSTYLKILNTRYLRGIQDPRSRLYCIVAAYNTGVGNVAKAFTGKKRTAPAIHKINEMTPEQVYITLLADLPHSETKKYLEKVIRLIDKYNGYGM